MSSDKFEFKQFSINQSQCAMKVGTDAVLLGAWTAVDDAKSILDIGTGTGVIAIMLAQKSEAMIKAIDTDLNAVEQCKQNVLASPWANRIAVLHTSLQNFAQVEQEKFDLIVSNPPYFIDSYKAAEEARNNARHAHQLPFEDLINGVLDLLKSDGKFCLILPVKESQKLMEIAQSKKMYLTKITHIKTTQYKDEKRLLLQYEFIAKTTVEDTIVIEQDERHVYSEAYKLLTKDFYLAF